MTDLVNASDISSGELFKSSEHEGELLLVQPTGYRPEFTTSAGTSDVIEARIVVLDGEHKGDEFADALMFGKVIVPALRRNIGKTVVGRLGKGVAAPGKNAAWQLNGATDADLASAKAYLAGEIVSAAPAAGTPPF